MMLELLRGGRLEVYVVAGPVAEGRIHFLRRAGVNHMDLRPVDTIVVHGVTQHDERLQPVIGEQRLAFEMAPFEMGFVVPAHEEESVSLINLGEVYWERRVAVFHGFPV